MKNKIRNSIRKVNKTNFLIFPTLTGVLGKASMLNVGSNVIHFNIKHFMKIIQRNKRNGAFRVHQCISTIITATNTSDFNYRNL